MAIESVLTTTKLGSLIIWFLFWVLGWFGFYILPKNKQDYIKNYLAVSLYFLIISLFIAYYYQDILYPIYTGLTIIPLVIIVLSLILFFLIYFVSNKFLVKPVKFLKKYSTSAFLELDYRYLMSKSFEIFYQQLLIIVIVKLLFSFGLDLSWITLIFMFMFGFSHIGILRYHKNIFGTIIFVAAIFSSFLFPYLIITFKYGFIYTFIAHWFFYSNTGVLFWLLNQVEKIAKEDKRVIGIK